MVATCDLETRQSSFELNDPNLLKFTVSEVLQNEGYTAVQLWAGLPAPGDFREKGRLVSKHLQDCSFYEVEIMVIWAMDNLPRNIQYI